MSNPGPSAPDPVALTIRPQRPLLSRYGHIFVSHKLKIAIHVAELWIITNFVYQYNKDIKIYSDS